MNDVEMKWKRNTVTLLCATIIPLGDIEMNWNEMARCLGFLWPVNMSTILSSRSIGTNVMESEWFNCTNLIYVWLMVYAMQPYCNTYYIYVRKTCYRIRCFLCYEMVVSTSMHKVWSEITKRSSLSHFLGACTGLSFFCIRYSLQSKCIDWLPRPWRD